MIFMGKLAVQYTGFMYKNLALTAHTALFTPATRMERVRKALTGAADVVIIDLEDAVAPADKDVARQNLREFLQSPSVPQSPNSLEPLHRVVVRINPPLTVPGKADLKMLRELLPEQPVAIMVPEVEATEVLDELVADFSAVIGLVETPTAVRDIHKLAGHPRIDRLAVGAVDLSVALGCNPQSTTIDAARSSVVLASAIAGLPAPLESPCVEFTNEEVVVATSQVAVRDGFGGMLCIHPAQLEPVAAAFEPTAAEIQWAKRVVAVREGVGSVDGQMVDRPVVLRAQQILAAIGDIRPS